MGKLTISMAMASTNCKKVPESIENGHKLHRNIGFPQENGDLPCFMCKRLPDGKFREDD